MTLITLEILKALEVLCQELGKGEATHLESWGPRGSSQHNHFTDGQTKAERVDGIQPGAHRVVELELEPGSLTFVLFLLDSIAVSPCPSMTGWP